MDDLDVPEDLQEEVRGHLEEETHPGTRTLAIFDAEDGLFEVYRPQVHLPESFRWGVPDVASLTLGLDEYEPYGAVVLDAERFRYFVVSPLGDPDDEAEEVKANGFREIDLRPSQPCPRSHGSADMDPAGPSRRRRTASTRRWGSSRATSAFREALPHDLDDRVVAEEPVELEGEILDRLEEIREQAEFERKKELLAEIRERGVEETITALQEENRVYHLAVLWDLEGEARWSDDRLATLEVAGEETPHSGPTRVRPFIDVLVDLAAARGVRLDFIRGENENADTLRDEFGGVAA